MIYIYIDGGEDISHMEMLINGKKSGVGKYGCDKKMKRNDIKREKQQQQQQQQQSPQIKTLRMVKSSMDGMM